MINASWRKRFSILQNRLYLYPAPEPLERTRLFWIATGLVSFMVLAFCTYFILYLTGRHDALMTSAEDLGIMDQALWNQVHGHMLSQTICNILHDTNCYSADGVPRFAIHFEPILFAISWLYLLWPDPKTLLVVQTLVVGAGAFPAFWLARLRLRNELAGVVIALLYLLYPAQQQATVYDFHAVTFTAALLLFTLYFMYTRRTVWLFVFAILSMLCKEEIPLVIAMFGLWSVIFQRRWRSGLLLIGLGVVYFAIVYYVVFPAFSPIGKPLLLGRYDQVGDGPGSVLLNLLRHPRGFLVHYVLDRDHITYLRILFAPAGYLPPLAPWILLLAAPSLAINMLSSKQVTYSGLFQYNAEIVPVLIFATIESMVLILWIVQVVAARVQVAREKRKGAVSEGVSARPGTWRPARLLHGGLLAALLCLVLVSALRTDYYFHGNLPYSQGYRWPVQTPHTRLAQRFMDMIPADASVSAQTMLVPHLSHRQHIYLFPYQKDQVDYVFLDVTGDIYPYYNTIEYVRDVKKLLLGGQYGIVAAQDGYLLLKHGLPSRGLAADSLYKPAADVDTALLTPNLPQSFCSDVYVSPQEVINPLRATFTDPTQDTSARIDLVGYNIAAPSVFHRTNGFITITTYWQVTRPIPYPLSVLFFLKGADGQEYLANYDVPALFWCQSNTWKPGAIVKVTTRAFGLQNLPVPKGLAHMSLALLPQAQTSGNIMDIQARLQVHLQHASATIATTQDSNGLELMPMTVVP